MAVKKDIRDLIAKAAEQEFLRHGFQGARTQAIADAAGTNKALLHYYYQSKLKLYEHVLERQFASFFESLFSLVESDADFDTWLKGIIHNYLREVVTKPNFSRFMLWEVSGHGLHLPGMIKKLMNNRGRDSQDVLDLIRTRLSGVGLDDYDPLQFMLNVLSLCVFPSLARPIVSRVFGNQELLGAGFMQEREREVYLLITQGIFRRKGNES